jgi:signal peptidase I
MESIDKQEQVQSTKPRNALIAFLFSLFAPGLGQVYNGQVKKGVLFFCLLCFSIFIYSIFDLADSFIWLCIILIINISLQLWIIIDAVIQARKQADYIPKSYNRWYYNLAILIAMMVIVQIIDIRSILGIQSFVIPTISNAPTIQIGDRLVADMDVYETEEIDYGHIAVFDGQDGYWTFRVVALPNDTLSIEDHNVIINGVPNKLTELGKLEFNGYEVTEYEVEMPNGHQHKIFVNNVESPYMRSQISERVLGPDEYYVLGDNRGDAYDSRYIGTISKDQIHGRIIYSFWGKGSDRINVDFTRR